MLSSHIHNLLTGPADRSGTAIGEPLLLLASFSRRLSTLNPTAGKCVLIVDGRRVEGAACAVDIEDSEYPQAYGFLSASFEVLKRAQLARHVQIEVEDGRIVSISILQVHPTGIALIALARSL